MILSVSKKFRDAADACWGGVKLLLISYLPKVDETKQQSNNKTKPELSGTGDVVTIETSRRELILEVLKRCGNSVLELNEKNPRGVDSFLERALGYCPQLQGFYPLVATQQDDENLSRLCAKLRGLKQFWLTLEFDHAKLCYDAVPADHLELLIFTVRHCKNPSIGVLDGQKRLLNKCSPSVLKKIQFDYLDDEFLELTGQMINLDLLYIEFRFVEGVTRNGLNHILKLRNLKRLILRTKQKTRGGKNSADSRFTDDFFMVLSENLPLLETLEIFVAGGITDKGLKSLASLPKLKKLRIYRCDGITDQYLVLFSHLKELMLLYCNEIYDAGVIKLLKETETMELLRLSYTKISNATIEAAVEATKRRTNNINLTLSIFGTRTSPMTIKETSPLLTICHSFPFVGCGK